MTEYLATEGNYSAAAATLPVGEAIQQKLVEWCDTINDAANGKSLSLTERAQILADDGNENAQNLLDALALVEKFTEACGLSGASDYVEARSSLRKFLRMLVNDMQIVSREDIRDFEATVPKISEDAPDFSIDVKPRKKSS